MDIPFLVLLLILIGARLALPYVVKDYVNRKLGQLQDYRGRIHDVRIDLYRGAYKIINLQLVKRNGQVTVPFITVPEMDLSLDWAELFHGAVVGKITANRPSLNFVQGPSPAQKQVAMDRSWKQILESLFPFTINRFQINEGRIHFLDPSRDPKVNLYIAGLYATATNLTNVRQKNLRLPSGLIARGNSIGGGRLYLELHLNPLANTPTFKLVGSITNVDLTALNPFLQSYGGFDAERGSFALFLDIAAADEHYQGFAKPFFFDLQVFDLRKESKKDLLHVIWEAVIAGISQIFRNQPYNQVATSIPISGTFKHGTQVDLWGTIAGILQNAFVQALKPQITRSVPLPSGDPSRAPPR